MPALDKDSNTIPSAAQAKAQTNEHVNVRNSAVLSNIQQVVNEQVASMIKNAIARCAYEVTLSIPIIKNSESLLLTHVSIPRDFPITLF